MRVRYIVLAIIFSFFVIVPLETEAFANLAGRIILQVEGSGEAWYVEPQNLQRYYLGRPRDAFVVMKNQGLGIKHAELKTYLETSFPSRLSGRILLDVEANGEAYYIYPVDMKAYYLARPEDAFGIMKDLGLGISNQDLDKLVAMTPNFDSANFETRVHELINIKRVENGLGELQYNDEVASVARLHSQNLAEENFQVTAMDSYCSFPLIHHEGLDANVYHGDRLKSAGLMYYNQSAENIALLSSAAINLSYMEGDVSEDDFQECEDLQTVWDDSLKDDLHTLEDTSLKLERINTDLEKRKAKFESSKRLEIKETEWQSSEELAQRAVEGWMDSPGHRKNILTTDFDEAGIGLAYVNSYVIITQVFITRTDCGYSGAACCVEDQYYLCYKPNTCVDKVCVIKE